MSIKKVYTSAKGDGSISPIVRGNPVRRCEGLLTVGRRIGIIRKSQKESFPP